MKDIFRVAISQFVISIMLCCMMTRLAYSDEFASIIELPQEESEEKGDEKAAEGSRRTFSLPRHQSVIQCFELIRQSIERGDPVSALPLIERVLSEPNSFVPAIDSNEVAVHEEAWRLLRSMPADVRRRFNESRGLTARRAWDETRAKGMAEFPFFLQQFSDQKYGVDAWWWIASYERDHGRVNQAAAAFDRVAQHPEADVQQRAVGLLGSLESLLAANRWDDAHRVSRRLASFDPKLNIVLGGQFKELGELLKQPPFLSRATGSNGVDDDQQSAREDWKRLRPVLLPVWKQEFSSTLHTGLDALEQRQRDQGVRPLPISHPVIAGSHLIVRNLNEIASFDVASGREEWRVTNTEYQLLGKRTLESVSLQPMVMEWAQRRTEADSIFGQLSTDGRRVFAIQEPDRAGDFWANRDSSLGTTRSGPRFNQLCSYSVDTGNLEWQAFAGVVFLGCPLVLDDALYVIAQRESEVLLMCLDSETGEVRTSLPLGTVSLTIRDDLQRSRIACPIVWHQGLLLCSTSSGAVIAVDPLLQAVKWCYRYPATSVASTDVARVPRPGTSPTLQEQWWDGWREPFAAVASLSGLANTETQTESTSSEEFLFVFASPETDQLHAFCLPEGKPLWRIPRSGGLFVSGFATDVVVVAEGESVRGHHLRDGSKRWQTSVGEIGGPPVVTGPLVVVPLRSGGTLILDGRDGKVLSDSALTSQPLGVLTQTERGWIAFHRQHLMLLPRLSEVRRQVDLEMASNPGDESLRVRAALLDLQAGEEDSARERLAGLTSSPARDLRRQALIAALGRRTTSDSSLERIDLARELNELSDTADYKFAAAATIGTSALAVNDLSACIEAALTGLSENFERTDSFVKKSSVMVRKDRILLGLIEEAYRRAKPDEVLALDGLFDLRLKAARKSRDRFAVPQLADYWRGIDWGRRIIVTEEEKSLRKRPLLETELRLLDAAGAADQSVASRALDRLAARFDRLGMLHDAQAIRDRRIREFSGAAPAGESVNSESPGDTGGAGSSRVEPEHIWPLTAPMIEPPRKDRNFGVYCPLVPVHADPESLASRLDIAVDRTGTEVVFRGEGFFQSGQDEEHERKFPLPKSGSLFRGPTGYMLREAWGIGRIVILLVGSELFAISPLDEQGEPNSRFLWSNPIDLQLPSTGTRIVPPRQGIFSQRHLIIDDSGRRIGMVGPVRANYLCYQMGSRLVAVETETGRELWRRLDLPPDATVLGDDHHLFVWCKNKSIEILSAIDGRKLSDGSGFASPDSIILDRGSLVWTAGRIDGAHIELRDLATDRLVWSRSDPVGSMIAVLDSQTLATVTPDGKLNLLNAETGVPICDALNVNSTEMTEIAAWSDADRWYIALSRPVDELTTLRGLQPNDGYRVRFLNGPFYAVNRQQPAIAWQREFKNEPLSLDQSRVAPVFVQLWRVNPKSSSEASRGALRVIDKRNGKSLLEKNGVDILPYWLLNPDPQQSILELKLTQETIRFRYSSNDTSGNESNSPRESEKD